MDKENKEQKTDNIEAQILKEDSLGYKDRSQDILKELAELKDKNDKKLKKGEEDETQQEPKDIFLIITRDTTILNPSLPAGKLVLDISSVVPELHIICIGIKQQLPKKIGENTFIYTAWNIPFFNFFTVYQVILSQLVWKRHFIPTTIVSIGDEIRIAKKFARKYDKSLYVFYSYMKVLGKGKISLNGLINSSPKKIIVPNEYIAKAVESHRSFKPALTKVKILAEYIDIPELEHILEGDNIAEQAGTRNKSFNMLLFPHRANIGCFLMIKNIIKEISHSITRFQFVIVVKRSQFLQAKIMLYLSGFPAVILKDNKDSVNLFRTSRVMLYFDREKVPYEPVFFSFISGCPVLSSGDEYSKIILFNSGFEEFGHIERIGKVFGKAIRKLINDPYLYSKYKINCIEFAKTAFTHDRSKYIADLKDSLNISA